MNVGHFLRRPPNLFVMRRRVIQFEELREALDVAALLEEVLVGCIVLEQTE